MVTSLQGIESGPAGIPVRWRLCTVSQTITTAQWLSWPPRFAYRRCRKPSASHSSRQSVVNALKIRGFNRFLTVGWVSFPPY